VFTGYFEFAGQEIGNAARAYAYATRLSPAMGVNDPLQTGTLPSVLLNSNYNTPVDDVAPWYDRDDEDTWGFYGAYPLELTNLDSSTREADVTEGIADGGFIGRSRQTSREVLVRMALYGKDAMAVNAGLTWLRESLAINTSSCSLHGSLCGTNDFSFLSARPAEGFDTTTGTERYRRYLHGVGLTAPVRVLESREIGPKGEPCGFYARVEFGLTAENPEIFHHPRIAELTPLAGPVPVGEPAVVVVNRAPNPSFEDFTTFATIRQNLVTQPSGEGSVDDWRVFSTPGAAVEASIGTIDPPTGAPFGRGFIRLFFNEKTGPPSQKIGLRFSISVVAGKRYSFGVESVITSVLKSMELSVEWRTDTTAISEVVAQRWDARPNQTSGRRVAENLVAPPFATRAHIRISSGFGPRESSWPQGSTILVDGVMAAEGQFTPNYFDGSTRRSGDVSYVWEGVKDSSRSTMRAPLPLGMIPAEETFKGGKGAAFRTAQVSLFGGHGGAYLWRDSQLSALPTDFGMGGDLSDLPSVSPGLTYVASLHVFSSRDIPVVAQLTWFDGGGDVLAVEALPEQVIGARGWFRFAVDGVAPALAAFAALKLRVQTATVDSGPYRLFRSGDSLFVDGAMITQGPNLYEYFDGSTLTNGIFDYEWNGGVDSSPSRRFGFDPTLDDLVDPLLPEIMEPPRPPPIPDIALPSDTVWGRVSTTVSDSDVYRWAKVYPIIRITSNDVQVRRVRVGLTPDPFAGTGDPQYIADIDRGFIISYLPPQAVLTVDSSVRRAWVQIGQGPARPAGSLIFGLDGGPMQWPVLDGGLGYVLTVDTPDQGSATPVDLVVVRKE
jgi:hypothetical protein